MISSLLLLLAPLAVAGPGTSFSPLRNAGRTSDPRGIEAIRADHIRADLFFFADDEMHGRDTPSPEQRIAARFLRARLERLGFSPGAEDGFFFRYPLKKRRVDAETSYLELRGKEGVQRLGFGTDYFVSSSKYVRDASFNADLVFGGEASRDDLDGLDLGGTWILAVDRGGSQSRRARNAERAGAAGLFVVVDLAADGEPVAERYARATALATKGVSSVVSAGRSRPAPLPVFYLSRDATEALLASAGLEGFPKLGTKLNLSVEGHQEGSEVIQLEDVCALWPGEDPELSKEVILVSAHYDHVGVREGKIYNGADDNGSGSMGLLAVAEALAAHGPMRRSVMLIWVSGEEKGLWGSAAWTKAPTLPEGSGAVCDLNIDMIGRNAPDHLLLTPSPAHKASNGLSKLVTAMAPLEGFPSLGSADAYWARSDHMNFSRNMEIPVAFLFSGEHEDYHKPTDTPDKIDFDKIERVARLVFRVIANLQDNTFPS